jgi:very-short-patch-repair endonuclease
VEALVQGRLRLIRGRLLGWTILHFTADDVLRNPVRVPAQVVAAISTAIN